MGFHPIDAAYGNNVLYQMAAKGKKPVDAVKESWKNQSVVTSLIGGRSLEDSFKKGTPIGRLINGA
jgi:hypothetical protein